MRNEHGAADHIHAEFPSVSPRPDVYLLGGQDLEMARISKKAKRAGAEVVDLSLSQREASNDGVSRYTGHIPDAMQSGKIPVAIELAGADNIPGVVDIDHHNDKTDRPASILQVFERLGIEPKFGDRLIAANDTGHIPKMQKLLDEEYPQMPQERKLRLIGTVRAMERKIKGVTEEMEKEAEEAVEHAERRADGIIVVRINGTNFDPVQDRLAMSGENKNLVVICSSDQEEKEVWFFGNGEICRETADHFRPMKEERKRLDPSDTSNEYHTVGNGTGYGKKDENALCLVVAKNPEEVIDYISDAESQQILQ